MIFKTIDFYQYAVDNLDFKYIYRIQANAYLDLELLDRIVKEKPVPEEKAYYSHSVCYWSGIPLGAGIGLLSRDLVEFIVRNKHRVAAAKMRGGEDDVAIGKFLCGENGIDVNLLQKRNYLRSIPM